MVSRIATRSRLPIPGARPSLYERARSVARRFIQAPLTESAIVGLIIVSVVLIIWTALYPEDSEQAQTLFWFEDLITYVFIGELAIRYWVERRKSNFFRHYWIDILAVLPALRVFRMFRVLRLLRILRVLRLFRAGLILSRRLSDASQLFRQGLAHYFLIAVIVFLIVLFAALALVHFETQPSNPEALQVALGLGGPGGAAVEREVRANTSDLEFDEALWWAVFTVVASEPIDYSARTTGGRIVTFLVMFAGLTVFAFITGVISAFMVERLRMGLSMQEIYPEDLDGHFIVLGWNNRAPFIIEEIQAEPKHRRRFTVVLADRDEPEAGEWLSVDRNLIHFVHGDPINPQDLEKLNIPKAFSVVILADSCHNRSDVDRDARTVLCALMVEKVYPSVFTCAELINRAHASHLKLAGVEEVVIANESSAAVLAMATLHLDMTKILAELLSFKVGNQFYKVNVPATWAGRAFVEAVTTIKKDHDGVCIGVAPRPGDWDPQLRRIKERREILINPPSELALETGDKLLIVAARDIRLR